MVGMGTLTIDGAGTYTGGTTVSEGALVVGGLVDGLANTSAALSGGGPISVGSGGTLGGYGSVTGDVTNSGILAPGSASQLSGSPMGAFTIKGNYAGAGGTMAINTAGFSGATGRPPTYWSSAALDLQLPANTIGARNQCRWCGWADDRQTAFRW